MPSDAVYLILYLLVLVGTLIICRLVIRRADRTDTLVPLPVPVRIDPYEVAYLCGRQKEEVERLAVLDLISSGYLKMEQRRKKDTLFGIEMTPGNIITVLERAREGHGLPWHLRTVLNRFGTRQESQQITDLWADEWSTMSLRLELEERLRRDRLLATGEAKSTSVGAMVVSLMVLVPLTVSVLHEMFGMFSEPSIVVLTILVISVMGACNCGWLSKRGKVYLSHLQLAYRDLSAATPSSASPGGANPSLLIAFALFGTAGLQGTGYEFLGEMFITISEDGGTW